MKENTNFYFKNLILPLITKVTNFSNLIPLSLFCLKGSLAQTGRYSYGYHIPLGHIGGPVNFQKSAQNVTGNGWNGLETSPAVLYNISRFGNATWYSWWRFQAFCVLIGISLVLLSICSALSSICMVLFFKLYFFL
jgi:hypothetical protein